MIALRSATAAALLLCASCAAPPSAPLPPVGARTADASARAATLVRAGDYAGAARRYEEALALARSVEDADAIAANALNLSVVYQWMGRDGSARDALKIVLDDSKRPFPEPACRAAPRHPRAGRGRPRGGGGVRRPRRAPLRAPELRCGTGPA
jgi:hypothetical protein